MKTHEARTHISSKEELYDKDEVSLINNGCITEELKVNDQVRLLYCIRDEKRDSELSFNSKLTGDSDLTEVLKIYGKHCFKLKLIKGKNESNCN